MNISADLKTKLFLPTLIIVGAFCLTPWMPPFLALVAGALVAIFLGNPYQEKTSRAARWLLALSVVGLGAGMNLETVASVGIRGIGYTLVGIGAILALGFVLGRVLKSDWQTSILISCGTAICGGSAIAAVAPVIQARPQAISVSLGTVFLLNAVALALFPVIGHALNLSQAQFGLWSALAIHDTSSVVGAGLQYGAEALRIGTTVKLARALWIVPLAISMIYLPLPPVDDVADPRKRKGPKKPWFILGFLAMAAVVTYIPELQAAGHMVEAVARRVLVLTLFLIGSSLTLVTLKSVGLRPLLQGVLLWVFAASASLLAILSGIVHL